MTITKPMQQALDQAVNSQWRELGARKHAPIMFSDELPDSWLPEWWDSELTESEITDEQSRELDEITELYNQEFKAIWQSYYEEHLQWLEEEEEHYNYLRTESVYW